MSPHATRVLLIKGVANYDHVRSFVDYLRNGSDFDSGLGPDVIITADGEEMADQRFPDVTNGAENEDLFHVGSGSWVGYWAAGESTETEG